MTRQYGYDWMDGRKVPQLVIRSDHVLTGTHPGTVHVEAGRFTLAGVLQGTLDVQTGATALINGTQQGTITLASGTTVIVIGAIEGTTNVEANGTLVIEAGAKLAGTLVNHGLVILRGVFGGERVGPGELRIEGQGHIKQPTIRDGFAYYEW